MFHVERHCRISPNAILTSRLLGGDPPKREADGEAPGLMVSPRAGRFFFGNWEKAESFMDPYMVNNAVIALIFAFVASLLLIAGFAWDIVSGYGRRDFNAVMLCFCASIAAVSGLALINGV